MPARRIEHPLAFAEGMRQGLLDVDILAGGARHDGHQRVPVVGRRDDDGVDVGSVEHAGGSRRRARARCPRWRCRRRAAHPRPRRSLRSRNRPAPGSPADGACRSSRCRRSRRARGRWRPPRASTRPQSPARSPRGPSETPVDVALHVSVVRRFCNLQSAICNLQSAICNLQSYITLPVKLLLSTQVLTRREFLAGGAAVAATSARAVRAAPARWRAGVAASRQGACPRAGRTPFRISSQ